MAGQPLSQLLIKPAGADCNLRCTYCFYLEKSGLYPQQRVHRMPNDVLREMVRQMMATGQRQVGFSWQGGEPTLMGLDHFRRAVEYQQQFGYSGQVVANSLQTNGLLIDADWCRFFAEFKFLIGLSIDGPPEIHDYYRKSPSGKSSHAYALRAAQLMTEHGVEFNILAVVNDFSARHARRIYRYFQDQGWHYLQFIPCVERDPRAGEAAPFVPSPEAYGDFLCEIFEEWKKDFRDGWPTVSERMFDSLMHTYLGMPSPMCIFMDSCGDYVVVEHNGDVYSCDFFVDPDHYLGNLRDRELRLLAASDKQFQFGESKRDRPPECSSCRWLQHCYGGCLKDRFTLASTRGSNYFCKSYKQLFAHSESTFRQLRDLWIEREQAASQPAPEPTRDAREEAVPAQPPAGDETAWRTVGRNDPCPCGSGRKFKKCCMPRIVRNQSATG